MIWGRSWHRYFSPLQVLAIPKQYFMATESSSGCWCHTLGVAGWVNIPKHTPLPAHSQLWCHSSPYSRQPSQLCHRPTLAPEGPTCPARTGHHYTATDSIQGRYPLTQGSGGSSEPQRLMYTPQSQLRAASSLPQPCPPPAPPFPSPGRSIEAAEFHQGEPGGSTIPLPKALSHHSPFQTAPSLLRSQGSS